MTDFAALPASRFTPGLYRGVSDVDYHGDTGSLSSSGARTILAPSSPYLYRDGIDHPSAPTAAMELGTAVHTMVLGAGTPIVEIPFTDLRTKAAKEAVAEAKANGQAPLKPAEYRKVKRIADAVRQHPGAAALLESGEPESSIWWEDPATGLTLRARPDFLPDLPGRTIIVDLKTSQSANPASFAKSAATFGYHVQQAWYCDGVREVGLDPDAAFVFIVVDTNPPHPVSLIQLPPAAQQLGADRMRVAVDLYAECRATNRWPSFGNDIHTIDLPQWAYFQEIA
ncbi:MAG: PD-(D/E)XK nuclease-like domain-containing protein [Gordonia sp. (in: high G+C Gram-positive bacteria)]